MYTRCFERFDNEYDEIINISEYGFEWYIGTSLIRCGLVEDLDKTVELLVSEGFEEIL